jgi:hypothetical protein
MGLGQSPVPRPAQPTAADPLGVCAFDPGPLGILGFELGGLLPPGLPVPTVVTALRSLTVAISCPPALLPHAPR